MIGEIRERLRDERGTSLVELLVTMIVAAIVLAATVATSTGLQRTAAQVFARQDQTDIGRQAADRLSTTLRSAAAPHQLSGTCSSGCGSADTTAFLSASGTAMSFISNLDNTDGANGPVKVTYSIPATGSRAGHLVETVQKATLAGSAYSFCDTSNATCASTTVTTSDLTPGATVATSPVVFGYVDASGATVQPDGAALSASQLLSVMVVDLALSVQRTSATQADPTTYIGRIDLPNQQTVLQPR